MVQIERSVRQDTSTSGSDWNGSARALLAVATCLVAITGRTAEPILAANASHAAVDFVADVQPILHRACYGCHGPEKQRSGYRLDVREEAFNGGELFAPNVVPGDAAGSPLLGFIVEGGDLEMPPEGSRLSPDEVATIRAWIEQGATWPDEVAGKLSTKPTGGRGSR